MCNNYFRRVALFSLLLKTLQTDGKFNLKNKSVFCCYSDWVSNVSLNGERKKLSKWSVLLDNVCSAPVTFRIQFQRMKHHLYLCPSDANTFRVSCVIPAFRREVDENCVLLGCYAASSFNFLPTFRDNLSGPFFSVQESWNFGLGLLNREDGTDGLSRNVGKKLPLLAAW